MESQSLTMEIAAESNNSITTSQIAWDTSTNAAQLIFESTAISAGKNQITIRTMDAGLDGNIRTVFDNQFTDRTLNVVVGISDFEVTDEVLKINLRKIGQGVTIDDSQGGLRFQLHSDSWHGKDQEAASGADSSTLSVAPTANLTRIELSGNETQNAILSNPDDWQMGEPISDGDRFLRTIVKSTGEAGQVHVDMPNPWNNIVRTSDINNDGSVTTFDALMVIDELAR